MIVKKLKLETLCNIIFLYEITQNKCMPNYEVFHHARLKNNNKLFYT